jgi:APA family basic amino acid/polyamine antiporter
MAYDIKNCAVKEGTRASLPRVLGIWDVIAIVVGGVIGSGIFLVPKSIAAAVQSPILVLGVWVVGGVLSFFGALTFAELGAAMPEAGGMYVFLREAYGPLLSFLFGWTLFLVIDSGAVATLTVAFTSRYLPYFFKMTPLAVKVVSVLFIVFLGAVNYVGVRAGANLQNVLTIIKTAALVVISGAIFIFGKGNASNFVSPVPGSFNMSLLGSFGVALVASLWAFKGWEGSTYSAGEIKRPERNLPLGILGGSLIVLALYIITNLAYLYMLPVDAMAKSDRIASDAVSLAVGPAGGALIAFIILFSITGAANQNILCSPRVYFAMARDGLFFKRIAEAHPKYRTPHVSIVAISVWSIILSLFFGTFEQLFTYVVFGQWIFFGLTVAAVIVLRKKRPDLPRPYKTWGYPVTPVLFILAAVFISMNSLINEFRNAVVGLVIILLGVPAYFYWKNKRR